MGKHSTEDQNQEISGPTNPDLWGEDPFYDQPKGNRSVAIWAVALSAFLAIVIGGVGFLFGMGRSEATSGPTYRTITSEATVTEQVTVKSQKTVTKTPKPEIVTQLVPTPLPAKTIYRTPSPKPAPTITKTVTATPDTIVICYEDGDEIDCPPDPAHGGEQDETVSGPFSD